MPSGSTSTRARDVLPDAYAGLEPTELWRHFAALNAIPRRSGDEAAARAYVARVADGAGAPYATDSRGNIVVRVRATRDSPGGAPLAVQAHLDMVCEAQPDVEYDPARDPIVPVRLGDRIVARGTTLGADNGIGVAAALALMTTQGLVHGPLELLFTVEEETGLVGALALDPALLRARSLVNLDSEDPTAITIGCAGASTVRLGLAAAVDPVAPSSFGGCTIRISGLRGGHSGIDIDKPRANAVKLAAELLEELRTAGAGPRIGSLSTRGAHNVIPRRTDLELALPTGAVEAVVRDAAKRLRARWLDREPELAVDVEVGPAPERALSHERSDDLIDLLVALPHGVLATSERFAGTVQTSANLATVRLDDAPGEILLSVRSLFAGEAADVCAEIVELARRAGSTSDVDPGYPAWPPRLDSALLARASNVYLQVYGRPPSIGIVHGGLECGVIVAKLPAMEAVSAGPLISGAHTPEESLDIASVSTTWQLLLALLASVAEGDGDGSLRT